LIVPIALGVATSEALYTTLLPLFTAPGRPPRELLYGALRVALPLTVAAAAVYAAIVLAASPARLALWLVFAPVLVATGLNGVYAAFLTADRRYPLAILRVPLASGIALALAAALLPAWRSTTAIALAITVGQLVTLAFLAVQARGSSCSDAPVRAISARGLVGPAAAVFAATLVAGQLVIVGERFLAAGLATGAVALLAFARGIALLPAMFAQALGGGIFPAATERFEAREHEPLARVALTGIRLSILAALVSTALVVICRRDLVQIAFERHEFSASDASQTATLVGILAASLAGVSASAAASKTLFALGRRSLTLWISVGGVALYVAAALVLRHTNGLEGLAWAFVVASTALGLVFAGTVVPALGLRTGAVVRHWILAPLGLAAAFAAGALAVWAVIGGDHDGFVAAVAAVLATAAGGLVTLAAAVRLANGLEYALVRGVLRRGPSSVPGASLAKEASGRRAGQCK